MYWFGSLGFLLSLKAAIKSLDFFRSLSAVEIESLSSYSHLYRYTNEYILHYENQRLKNLEFLVSGSAKVYKIDKHENEIFLYNIASNSLLSEITDFEAQSVVTFSNIALQEDSKILSIDYALFKQQFLDTKILCSEFAYEAIERSCKMQDLLNREFIFDAVSKVAMMLSSDLEMFNKHKRHDISLMLHIQPATLSRVLNRLKRNNIIGIIHGQVKVLDDDALKNIYEEEIV